VRAQRPEVGYINKLGVASSIEADMADAVNPIGDDLLLEEERRREDILHGAADVVNTKASQIFAAAAFLAVQPAIILVNPPAFAPHPWAQITIICVQAIGCLPMVLSVFFAHEVLKIEEYAAPTSDDTWRGKVFEGLDKPLDEHTLEARSRARLTWAILLSTRERCKVIQAINETRLNWLHRSRRCLFAAMLMNAVSLAIIAAMRLF
jgi:hypothetical protein